MEREQNGRRRKGRKGKGEGEGEYNLGAIWGRRMGKRKEIKG